MKTRLFLLLSLVAVLITTFAFADSPSRKRRVLFFMADWCVPCHEAIESERNPNHSFKRWLQASGWIVDETEEAHIQLVNIDQRKDLAELYKIEIIPTMVLIEDGKMIKKEQYTGRKSILAMFEEKKPEAEKPAVKAEPRQVIWYQWDGRNWTPFYK